MIRFVNCLLHLQTAGMMGMSVLDFMTGGFLVRMRADVPVAVCYRTNNTSAHLVASVARF